MNRILMWMSTAVFAGTALFGQTLTNTACGQPPFDPTSGAAKGFFAPDPLAPELRLFYSLSAFTKGSLTFRYTVGGELYVTETVDLSRVTLPRVVLQSEAGAPTRTNAQKLAATGSVGGPSLGVSRPDSVGGDDARRSARARLLERPRMMELLSLWPDMIRALHGSASQGANVTVEVHHDGRFIEIVTVPELVNRTGELRQSGAVPVVVEPSVSGPHADKRSRPLPLRRMVNSVPDCSECTPSSSCDTECGYDPGKGGSVTCGEYGVCDPGNCECQSSYEYWTDWYFVSHGPTGYSECWNVGTNENYFHDEIVTVYRRDLYRVTTTCPNCPSCVGCGSVTELIGYQLAATYCYNQTFFHCWYGPWACCSRLCSVGVTTKCYQC